MEFPKNKTFTNKDNGFRWSIIGASESGKSQELWRILLQKEYGLIGEYFKANNIYIFSKRALKDKTQINAIKELEETYVDKITQEPIFDKEQQLYTEPSEFINRIKLICDAQNDMQNKDMQQVLLIFDDFNGSASEFVNSRSKYLAALQNDVRHCKISIIQIIHGLKKIDPDQWEAQTHISLYRQCNYDRVKDHLKCICDKYHKEALERYDESTRQEYGYFFINRRQPVGLQFCNTIDVQYYL